MTELSSSLIWTILMRNPQFVDEVKSLLEKGVSPNEKIELRRSFHLAVNDPEFSEQLMRRLDLLGLYAYSVYRHSFWCYPQYMDKVKSFFEKEITRNVKVGTTPLHIAVLDQEFSQELTELLIRFGADVNAKNLANDTVLHHAMRSKQDNTAVIKLLLESGADINARNLDGETPILLAATNIHCGPDILRELLRRGADPNIRCKNSSHPLLNAVKNTHIVKNEFYELEDELDMVKSNHLKVKLLLDFGCDVEMCDDKDNTLLHIAAMQVKPNIETIKLLVERGLSINAVGNLDKTILHLLTEKDVFNKDIFPTVLELGADVNAQDHLLVTPLHSLLLHWRPSLMHVFDLMMANGANPYLETKEGCNALHIASTPSDVTSRVAYKRSLVHVVKVLLSHGIDVNSKNNAALTPLAVALGYDRVNVFVIHELIQWGANVNCKFGGPTLPILHYVVNNLAFNISSNGLIHAEKIDEFMTVLCLLLEHGATLMGSQDHCIDTIDNVLTHCKRFGDTELVHNMWYKILNVLLDYGVFHVLNEGSRERVLKSVISGIEWDSLFEDRKLRLCQLFIKFFILYSEDKQVDGFLLEPRLLLYANRCKAEIELINESYFSHIKPMLTKYCDTTQKDMSFRSFLLHLLFMKMEEKYYVELVEFLYVHFEDLEILRGLIMSKISFKPILKFVMAEQMLLPLPVFLEEDPQQMSRQCTAKLPEHVTFNIISQLAAEDIGNYMFAFRIAREGQLLNDRISKQNFEETEEN